MHITPVNNVIYFRAKTTENDKEKRNVSPKDAAVATGAAGATGSAIAGKGTMKSFSEFNKKANTAAKNIKTGVEMASETTTKSKTILGKIPEQFQHYRKGLIEFGQNLKNSNLLKPILTSKPYKGAATAVGGVTAGFVALNGIGEMFSTITKRLPQFTQE
ncbi:MAG: hypothetical protein NC390_04810 [Fusobacterium sp.]|nr:hypothetical protein [Fusobacterium sp.]